MDIHHQTISQLAQRVGEFHRTNTSFRIYHGSTNSTRATTFADATSLNTSSLNNVISIDPQARTCLVESNLPMDRLVAATTPYRLVPPVVPEFPGITVGGAFSGTGGESSSFRHGFFNQCVRWIEVILADGNIVRASPSENADLFHGCSGTFGTIAIVTLMEIQLIPAGDFVEMTYHQIDSFSEAQHVMKALSKRESLDFVDGIMFSKSHGVIVSGRMVDLSHYESDKVPPVVTFSGKWDQWFYLHAMDITSKHSSDATAYRELAKVPEYFFRYDRGAFWTGVFVFEWFGVPFNRVTRYMLDWLMSTRTLYHGLHVSKLGSGYIIQDLALPENNAVEFLEWMDQEYAFYPLWLCPVKQNERISMHPHVPSATNSGHTTGETLLNIGVWTKCPPDGRINVNRKLEAQVKALHGMKWLYADTFYTEDEFWTIYDRQWYKQLRHQYSAEYLPDVFQKVRTVVKQSDRDQQPCLSLAGSFWPRDVLRSFDIWNRWPMAGITAVLSSLRGLEYLKASD